MDNMNIYYVCLSALQKAVRKNMLDAALKNGFLAWRQEPQRMYKRLWTILFEDVGCDLDVLYKFNSWRGSVNKWSDVRELVEALATGKKSQESVYASNFLTKDVDVHDLGLCSKLLLAREKWYMREFDVYDLKELDFPASFTWLVNLSSRGIKWSSEGFCFGNPYVNALHLTDADRADVYDECEPDTLFEGFMPLSALDKHTRIGKFALQLYAAKVDLKPYTIDQFGSIVFRWNGVLLRNKIRRDELQQKWFKIPGKEWAAAPEVGEYASKHLPNFNSLRNWCLKVKMADDVKAMQLILKDEFK